MPRVYAPQMVQVCLLQECVAIRGPACDPKHGECCCRAEPKDETLSTEQAPKGTRRPGLGSQVAEDGQSVDDGVEPPVGGQTQADPRSHNPPCNGQGTRDINPNEMRMRSFC